MSQISRESTTKDDRIVAYLKIVTTWKAKFSRYYDFKQIPRYENNYGDYVVTLASAIDFQFRRKIPVKHIPKPSIHKPDEKVLRLDLFAGWRITIISFLKDGTLPDDKAQTQKLRHLATRYVLLGELLYKKLYSRLHSDPYLGCLGSEEARSVMQEIHDGDYGNHVRGRSLAYKAIN